MHITVTMNIVLVALIKGARNRLLQTLKIDVRKPPGLSVMIRLAGNTNRMMMVEAVNDEACRWTNDTVRT